MPAPMNGTKRFWKTCWALSHQKPLRYRGLCLIKSIHLKEALNKLGKYNVRLVLYDAEFDHAYLIVDDFSPRIIIDPTYLQMFYNSERTGLSPLFVGTVDELTKIFEDNIFRLRPLDVYERILKVKHNAKDYVEVIWGYTAKQPPQKVIKMKFKN